MRTANRKLTLLIALTLALAAFAASASAQSNVYQITVNTASQSANEGAIDMQFGAGVLTTANACVTISNLYSDWTLVPPPALTGSVTGTLPGSVVINNGTGGCSTATTYTASTVNDYNQGIVYGTTIVFDVTLSSPTNSATTNSGSTFGLAFTDGSGNPLFVNANTTLPFVATITLNPDGSVTTATYPSQNNGTPVATIQRAYPLATAALPSADGLVTPASGGYYVAGALVPVVATPASAAYQFSNWSSTGGGSFTSNTSASTNFTMPAGAASVTANFASAAVQVMVQTNPSGLSFTVDGKTYTSEQTLSWTPGTLHSISTTSTQPGGTGVEYVWRSWSNGGAISQSSVPTPSTPTTYTATFTPEYLLTTAVSPSGGGTVTPTGTSNYYTAGTKVPLVATANAGYEFASWSGSPVAVTGTSSSASVTMSANPETVTAMFTSALTLSSTSVNFDTLYLGQAAAQTVKLTNTSSLPLTISSIKASGGTAPGDYGEINSCAPYITSMPGTLGAGKSCTIAVGILATVKVFSPTPSTSMLTIMDSAEGSPQTIGLTAQVINPVPSLSATSLNFSQVKEGTTSGAQTITVKNVGNTPVNFTGVTTSGNFVISLNTCTGSLAATSTASCKIGVEFAPKSRSAYGHIENSGQRANHTTNRVADRNRALRAGAENGCNGPGLERCRDHCESKFQQMTAHRRDENPSRVSARVSQRLKYKQRKAIARTAYFLA
jgi:hypothetical protein